MRWAEFTDEKRKEVSAGQCPTWQAHTPVKNWAKGQYFGHFFPPFFVTKWDINLKKSIMRFQSEPRSVWSLLCRGIFQPWSALCIPSPLILSTCTFRCDRACVTALLHCCQAPQQLLSVSPCNSSVSIIAECLSPCCCYLFLSLNAILARTYSKKNIVANAKAKQ